MERPVIRTIQVGRGFIDILNTDLEFINGLQTGIVAFYSYARQSRQTDVSVIQQIRERLGNTELSEARNIGFIVGWISELMQGKEETQRVQAPEYLELVVNDPELPGLVTLEFPAIQFVKTQDGYRVFKVLLSQHLSTDQKWKLEQSVTGGLIVSYRVYEGENG